MDNNSQIEFRRLLHVFITKCTQEGFDSHVIIAGMIMLETWIDQYADRKLLGAVRKDIKIR